MLLSVDGLKKRLCELQAMELQLAAYKRRYADGAPTTGDGPEVTFDAVGVRLTGVTQVVAVLDALLRSVEIQEALVSAKLLGIKRRPKAGPKAESNGVAGDQSDAVEP